MASKDKEIERLRAELAAMKSAPAKAKSEGMEMDVTPKKRIGLSKLAGIRNYVFTFKRETILDILNNAKNIKAFLEEHPEIE